MRLFDLHCDTLYECYETQQGLRHNTLAIDREKVRGFAPYAQVFALFCGARDPGYPAQTPGRRCLLDLPAEERLPALLSTACGQFAANADWIALCKSAADLDAAAKAGKAAAFLSIEGAELLCGQDAVQTACDAGVRIVTLLWNHENEFGTPAKHDQRAGLKPAGKALVRTLNQCGVICDVSHLSEAGFWDVAACSNRPFIASHSNSRTCCDHFRNLTDDQFTAVIQAKGLVGVNLYGEFVTARGSCTVDDVVRHIEHFCALGGEPVLALGADFDGCDTLPEGIADVSGMSLLAETLLRHNYQESTVNALFYDNACTFFHQNF